MITQAFVYYFIYTTFLLFKLISCDHCIPATPSQDIFNFNITFLHMNSPEQYSSLHKNCFYIINYWFTFLVMSPLPLLVSLLVVQGRETMQQHIQKQKQQQQQPCTVAMATTTLLQAAASALFQHLL